MNPRDIASIGPSPRGNRRGRRVRSAHLGRVLLALLTLLQGCRLPLIEEATPENLIPGVDPVYVQAATQIEYPDVDTPRELSLLESHRPNSLSDEAPTQYWDVSLEEVVRLALANSRVMKELGGVIIRSPGSIHSTFDPALQETDPRFGVQAALSAFDANFASSLFYDKNDRALNNVFFGGGTRILKQEAAVFQAQVSKRTATGTEFSLQHNVDYDRNNAPGNAFPSAWNVNFEAMVRQPLLRGAGIDFGRIAGTSEVPGVYNGVLIARVNNDTSLAEFEVSVRDFVSDVENAYWDLYYAYRKLDASIAARDAALETWRRVQALAELRRAGGEADKEAQAREQYYRFQEEVQNALTGQLVDPTRTYNGSSGGTFRNSGGVYTAERRLRYLIGVPINSEELLRPIDEPPRARIVFDWELCLAESLTKRAELRRQKWSIKRRELELLASRNFLLPDLDVFSTYRWRGFGDRLIEPDSHGLPEFDNAWANLTGGDFQEWQVGFELAFPFGNRQAHAAVRNAELALARERALLREQEQRLVHDLSNAFAESDRAYELLKTVYNRREAAREQLAALQAAFEADKAPLNLVLEAQRRVAAADIHYYEVLVQYAIGIKNMHFEKGTLLEYEGIHLAEGPWPHMAGQDAEERLRFQLDDMPEMLIPEQRIITERPEPVYTAP
ncbi:TolC family protein [Maioricimonas sp. JC845]|uniref:TolC family protein n=1 Tax=Maioricimonas sp. JC845 TaxID=3232138 RepID=UPI003459386F